MNVEDSTPGRFSVHFTLVFHHIPTGCLWWQFGIGHINDIALHRAGLVLRWVTIHGYTISVFNQATQAN